MSEIAPFGAHIDIDEVDLNQPGQPVDDNLIFYDGYRIHARPGPLDTLGLQQELLRLDDLAEASPHIAKLRENGWTLANFDVNIASYGQRTAAKYVPWAQTSVDLPHEGMLESSLVVAQPTLVGQHYVLAVINSRCEPLLYQADFSPNTTTPTETDPAVENLIVNHYDLAFAHAYTQPLDRDVLSNEEWHAIQQLHDELYADATSAIMKKADEDTQRTELAQRLVSVLQRIKR